MRAFLLVGPVIFFLFAGCSSSQGLRVESLHEILRQETVRFEGDRSDHPSAPHSVRPSPPIVGLYIKPTGFLRREFEWTGEDRDHVLTWAKELMARRILAGANLVPHSSLKGDRLAELRTAAARYGADLVLVLDGAAAVDRYNNYKAPLLYWTILGAYLADGTHSNALCLVKAMVWDVKTGAPVFGETAEAVTHKVGPAAFVDDRKEVERARNLALKTLLTKVAERFERSIRAFR